MRRGARTGLVSPISSEGGLHSISPTREAEKRARVPVGVENAVSDAAENKEEEMTRHGNGTTIHAGRRKSRGRVSSRLYDFQHLTLFPFSVS